MLLKLRWVNTGENHSPYINFRGESEPAGMPIRYYLKDATNSPVKIAVYRGDRMVYEMEGTKGKGLNEVSWGMVQRTRERNEREKNQVRQQIERMRGLGMDDAAIAKSWEVWIWTTSRKTLLRGTIASYSP